MRISSLKLTTWSPKVTANQLGSVKRQVDVFTCINNSIHQFLIPHAVIEATYETQNYAIISQMRFAQVIHKPRVRQENFNDCLRILVLKALTETMSPETISRWCANFVGAC